MGLDIDLIEIGGSVLLFCLVFGMSATVDIGCMMAQLKNRRAIFTGIGLQFVILPALGWMVVTSLQMSAPMGLTLLVVTSSPGGSYSNWWCSMFNADLALSVTMTAISTVLSTFMLPINLLIYSKLSYGGDILAVVDWTGLFIALALVISAIALGLYCSEKFNSHNFNLHANRLGNLAGICLVIFSAVMSNSDEDSQLWERPWKFYFGVAAPCLFGLIIANALTTGMELLKPERVTVSIECCYQNVGIATSVAISMFDGNDLAEAMGVPFYYGLVEAFILGIYCIGAWKAGWTKAPANTSIFKAISTSYEIIHAEKAEGNTIEMTDSEVEKEDDFHYIEHSDLEGMDGMESDKLGDYKTDVEAAASMGSSSPKKPRRSTAASSVAGEGLVNNLDADVRRSTRRGKPLKEPSYVIPPFTNTTTSATPTAGHPSDDLKKERLLAPQEGDETVAAKGKDPDL